MGKALICLTLTACSKGSPSLVDQLFGGTSNAPILNTVPDQIVQQNTLVRVDYNNVNASGGGSDADMSYTCTWLRKTGGPVTASADCSTLPNGTGTFAAGTGILSWTPSTSELGQYQISVTGTNKDGNDSKSFVVDVRLAFNGLESITNIQGDRMTLNWTANTQAAAYQILRKNSDGTFSIFKTITDPTTSTIDLLGLVPLASYTFRVAAVDSLGQLDGNTATISAVTANLIRLEVTAGSSALSPGQSTSVTVRLKDGNENYLNVSGLTVGVALSGTGTSLGTFSAVNDLGNGTYTSTFTATAPGTADSITASLTQYYNVETVAPIQVKPLQVEITTAQATLNPNQTVLLTAKIRDFAGNLMSNGGQGLSFTATGGTSTVSISAAVDYGTGLYTANLTGLTAGTALTLGATLSTNSTIYSTATVQVVPYSLEITSALSDVSVTRTTTVTGRVKDWQGHYLTTGGQGVQFLVVGSTGIVDIGATTDNNNGTYTATLTGDSLGSIVVSGQMTPSFTVTQTAAVTVRKLRLQISSSASNVMPGQVATLTGRVLDWQGLSVGVGGEALGFSASGGTSSGTLGTVTDAGTGVYTGTFTGGSAGSALTISGSITDSYQVDVTTTITVQKWRLYVTAGASSLATGQSTPVTLTVKNYLDVAATTGGQTVSFLQSGGTSTGTFSSVTDNGNGTYSATFTAVTNGTSTTISASMIESFQVIQTAAIGVAPIYLKVTTGQPKINPGTSAFVYAQVQDSGGNNLTAGSYSINFSYSGGTSTGSFSAVTYVGNGLYRSTFTAGAGGTAVTVTAAATVAYSVASTQTIQVIPWGLEITAASSALTISQTTTLTGKIVDYSGAYLTTGGFSYAMSLVTSGIGSISAVTDNNNGTYTATFTASGTGSTAVNATLPSSYTLNVSPTLTVTAVNLAVSVAQASMNPGGTTYVYAQVQDSGGNNITTGTYSISFSSSGGTSTGSFSSVTNIGNGLYRATFTGSGGGTAITIAAAATVSSASTGNPTITVVPWSLVITSTSSTLTTGQTATLTGKVYDYNGVALTSGGYGFAMSLGSSGVGTLSAVTDNHDGTYTATFTAGSAGTTTVGGTISASYTLTSSPTLTIAQPTLALSVGQTQMNPGSSTYVYAQVQDGAGHNLSIAGYSITFSYSGGTSTGTFGSVSYMGAGLYRSLFTASTGGTAVNIAATATVATASSGTPTIQVVPWALVISSSSSSMTIGQTATLTGRIQDYQGNYLTTGGSSLAMSLATSGVGSLSAVTDNGNGTYTATFTATSNGSTAVNATIPASYTVSSSPTLVVGKPYLAVTVSQPKINPAGTAYVYAQVQDSTAHNLPITGYTITFSSSSGTSTGTFGAVTDMGAGLYRAQFTGTAGGTALTVTASASVNYAVASTASLQVVPWSLTITSTATSLTIGQSATLTGTIADFNGTALTTGGYGYAMSLATSGVGSLSSVTDNNDGTYTATFTATNNGSTVVNGSLPSSYTLTSSPTIVVSKPYLAVTTAQAKVNPAGTTYVYAQVQDGAGHNVPVTGYNITFSASGGTSTGSFGAVTDMGAGLYRSTFTGTAGGTALTVTASANVTYGVASTASVQVVPWSLIITSAASTLTIGQTTALTGKVYDYNGVALTSGGQGFAMSLVTSGVGSVSSVTDNGDGSYSATFTATGTGSTAVSGTIPASYTLTSAPTIAVTKPYLAITSAQPKVNPTGTTYVYAQVQDSTAHNLAVTGYTITFSTSGGTSTGSFSAVTDMGGGLYRSTFTGATGGTAVTVTAAASVSYAVASTASLQVVPWGITITAATSALTIGQSTVLTAKVSDYNGTFLTTGGYNVAMGLVTSGVGSLSSVTDNNDGTYTASFSATGAGSTSVSGTMPSSYTLTSAPTLVVSQPYLAVTVAQASMNPAGTSFVYAQVQDSGGNNLNVGTYSISFSYSGGTSTGSFGAVSYVGNGLYKALFTGSTGGTAITISASASVSSAVASSQTITVVPWGLSISASSSTLTIGQNSTLTGKIVDYQGHYLTTGGYGFAMSLASSGAGTLSSVTDNNDGTYSATFTATATGSTGVNGTITASYTLNSSPTLTVVQPYLAITASQANVNPGQTAYVYAQVQDSSGNNLSIPGYSITFSNSGGTSTGNFGAVTYMGSGLYRAVFTGSNGGTATTITAAASVSYGIKSTASMTVVPWALVITATSTSLTIGQTTTITGRVQDWQGNFLTTGGQGYAMSLATSSIGSVSAVTDNNNGTYTTTFSASGVGTSTVNGSISSSYTVASTPTLTVTPVYLAVTVASAKMNPAGTSYVYAQVQDSGGNNITTGSYSISFSYSGGTSTGSFGAVSYVGNGLYKALFTGSTGGTAVTISAAATVSTTVASTQTIQVVPWSLKITSTSTAITVGQTATLTGRVYDYNNTAITTGGQNFAMGLATTGIGSLSSVTDNNDGSYTATFTASGVGSTAITGNVSSSYTLTTTPTLTVTGLHIALTVAQNYLNPSQGVQVSAQLKDAGGNNVSTGSYTIGFTYSGGSSTGSLGTTFTSGLGLYYTTFTGNVAGTATTVTANASVPYVIDSTVNLTVVPWNIVITSTSNALAIYETATVTATIKDWQGNQMSAGGKGLSLALNNSGIASISATTDNNNGTYSANIQGASTGTTVPTANMSDSFTVSASPTITVGKVYIYVTLGSGLSTSSLASGNTITATATLKNSAGTVVTGTGYVITFATSGGTSTVSQSSVTQTSTGVYQITYQGVAAGTALTVAASASVSYVSSSTAALTIIPGTTISAANSTLVTSNSTVRSGNSVTLTATLKDAAGNVMPGLSGVAFAKTTGSGIGTGTFSAVTDQGSGVYTTNFSGTGYGASPTTISASYGGVTVSQTISETVTSGVASQLTLAGPTTATANACSTALSFTFFDSASNPTTLASATSFTSTGLGYGQLYSDSACTSPITTVDVSSGSSQSQNFYFMSYSPGTYALSFSASGIAQTNTSYSIVVSSVLSWIGVSGNIDAYGSGSQYGAGLFDSTFNYTQGISTYNDGTNQFIIASDYSNYSVQKINVTSLSSISVVGAIGRITAAKGIPTGGVNASYCTGLSAFSGVLSSWCSGGQYTSGTGDGMLNNPYRTTVMNISGTNYAFVADYNNNRIVKYNADSGAYIGWSGQVLTPPTGGTGCAATAVGSTTPTWCTGGTAGPSTSAASISGSTSGGVNGGNSFRNPTYITNDGTYLYVYDSGQARIVQLDPATGLLVHWMGRISSTALATLNGTTSPTALSCITNTQSDGTSTTTAGQFTESWCSGGSSVSVAIPISGNTNAFLNSQFQTARGISFYSDGTYNWMLISDSSLQRVSRYLCGYASATPNCAGTSAITINSTSYYPGQFFGWTGWVATTTTNSATVPSSISSLFTATSAGNTGVATNGWAYYGGSTNTGNEGGFYNNYAMAVSGTTAYVGSASNYRIDRINLLTGILTGWIGRVSATPTSGASGCAGATAGSVAPGWCYGGTTLAGSATGAFGAVIDLTTDGTNLYVADRDNFRIAIHNLSTGAPVGDIGLRLNNQPSVWSTQAYTATTVVPSNTTLSSWYTNRDGIFGNGDQMVINGNYLYVSDTSNNRIKRYKWLDGSYQGWIGLTNSLSPTGGDSACVGALVGGFTPGWCQGGGFTSSTTFGFNGPRGLASDGTYLYVADASNHRIVRIRLSDGAFKGWLGYISTVPSDGDSGCTTASVGQVTPGWCIGGTSAANTGTYTLGGFNAPQGLSGFTDTDGKFYLIVGDSSNFRLQKIDVATPTNVSWVGVNASGSTACSTAASAMVMSWCATSGVTSSAANTTSYINNGYLNGTRAVTIDTSSSPYYAYVTSNSGRIMRFNATTGAFSGWIGDFSTIITNSGCASGTAAVSTATPSWCTGGTVTTGTGDGQFSSTIAGIYSDGTYIYAADTGNYRMMKYNRSTGAFVGWVGRVQSATGLGTGTGCSSTVAGGITPSWCTGGTSKGGYLLDLVNKKASFDTPQGVVGMGSYLYIMDAVNGRILSMPSN